MSTREADDLVYKALGDSRRRAILDLLRPSPRTTGEIIERFPELDRCTVMQHIGVLERAGLVIASRRGRERWNYLNPLPIKRIHDRWIGRYAAGAVNLLTRLKEVVEED
jgi:DNA-binding transcriptional ArsR family regulator